MTEVLGEITPYALAIALSPFGVVVAILLLSTPRPRATAGAFLAGAFMIWTASLLVWVFLGVKHEELATDGAPEGVHAG